VWEIRVVVGFDMVRGRSIQRSFTVRGDAVFAEQRRRELVEDHGVTRVDFATAGARLTVGELLGRFFDAPICGSRPRWCRTARWCGRSWLTRWVVGAWWC
jgi:hypothetical protein